MARWKAHGQLSIHISWTFSLSIMVSEIWAEMCTARLFSQGGRHLCTQILPGQGHPPSTILGIRKLETLGYPMVKTAFLSVPSFWHNTGVWQTDGQTDRYAVAYTATCKASFVMHCKNIQHNSLERQNLGCYMLHSSDVWPVEIKCQDKND